MSKLEAKAKAAGMPREGPAPYGRGEDNLCWHPPSIHPGEKPTTATRELAPHTRTPGISSRPTRASSGPCSCSHSAQAGSGGRPLVASSGCYVQRVTAQRHAAFTLSSVLGPDAFVTLSAALLPCRYHSVSPLFSAGPDASVTLSDTLPTGR
jgi:hypothetical protein